jgi:hypothetical protein
MLDVVTAPPSARLGFDVTPEPVVALPPPRPRPSRRAVLVVAATLVAVLAAVAAVVTLRPPTHSDEPVVVPETLLGMPVSRTDFAATPGWSDGWELDGAVGGRGYAAGDAVLPGANLIVARQDISGDDDPGDVGMAGDVEQRFGEVSCTQQLDFSSSADVDADPGFDLEPYRSDSMLVCWRSRSDLTVSVLLLGLDRGFGAADVAAAVDEVWALQG